MACNEDLRKQGTAYPRTCADCGLGPCAKYAVQPKVNTVSAWVLWHRYGDGSGAHIERVYLDQKRATDDHYLLANQPNGSGQEWKLDEVPIFGAA